MFIINWLKQLRGLLFFSALGFSITADAIELPDCNAIAMSLSPLMIVPGVLPPPAQLPFAQVVKAIGPPNKKTNVGYIYRWRKEGYVFNLAVIKNNHAEESRRAWINFPARSQASQAALQERTPAEFNQAVQLTDKELAAVQTLLGTRDMEKLQLFTYTWRCYSYAAVINGKSATQESRVIMTFDERGNWIDARY